MCIYLSDPLGGAHYIGRIYGLIRRYHYEFFHAIVYCQLRQDAGTGYIIYNCRRRVLLHQGHMLICCSMVYDIGFIDLKNLLHAHLIFDITDKAFYRGSFIKAQHQLMQWCFCSIAKYNYCRTIFDQLSCNLTSDRSCRTGHQDFLPLDFPYYTLITDRDDFTIQQLFNIDIFQLCIIQLVIGPFFTWRHLLYLNVQFQTGIYQEVQFFFINKRFRQDQQFGTILF
ncbi:hypothetical protein D3C80_1342500 [compost metagenome]